MNKKFGMIVLAIVFMMTMVTFSYTQEQPAAESTAPAADTATVAPAADAQPAPAKPLQKEEVEAVTHSGARSFSDGYNTFINSKVFFQLQTSDNIYEDQVFYTINNAAETKYTAPFSIAQEGMAAINYYSVDKVGNREYQKNINVIVDNTAPEAVVILSAPFVKIGDKYYVSENFVYTYSVTAKDNLSGVASIQYSTDGQTFQAYTAPIKITFPDGPQGLKLITADNVANSTDKYASRLIDEAGNVIDMDPKAQFVIDKKGPAAIIKADKEFIDKEGKKIAAKEYNYTIEATDEESGVKEIFYRLDSQGDFIPYTGAIQLKTNGEHLIEAIAKDKVGNSGATASLPVFVDIIAPTSDLKMVLPN